MSGVRVMAIIDIKTVDKVLIVTVSGDASASELVAVIEEFYPKKEVSDVIWDFTDGSWKLIPQSGFMEIARAARVAVLSGTRQNAKTAFVGSAGLEFGLHRMYQATAESSGVPIKYNIFRTLEEAQHWME